MGINKFDQVYLSSLKGGDRFYFPNKKTEVCEFISRNQQSLRHAPTYNIIKDGKDIEIKKDRMVVYLRNIND